MIDREFLLNDIEARRSQNGGLSRDTFAIMVGDALEENGTLLDYEPAYFQRKIGRSTVTLDAYNVDHERQLITLVIADFEASETALINDKFIEEQRACITALIVACSSRGLIADLDASEPIRPCLEAFENYNDVHIRILSTRRESGRLGAIEQFDAGNARCSMYVSPLQSVLNLLYSPELEPIKVDFVEQFSACLPCMQAASGKDVQCWLAVVPGEWLAKIYEKYQGRLLEQNVRSFLQFKGGINKGIKNTILNTPDLFFAYNNGISATVTDIVFDSDSQRKIRSVTGLQIVNGGQTTASLYQVMRDNKNAPLTSVCVMAKITRVEQIQAQDEASLSAETEIVQNISRFANSQNKINDSDFFSNHPFHVAVEKVALREWVPQQEGTTQLTKWFYERVRGGYANYIGAPRSLKDQKDRKNTFPAAQRIDKIELAKANLTFQQVPHTVSQGGQKAFAKFAEYVHRAWTHDDRFVTTKWWQRSVAEYIMIRDLTRAVSGSTWYNGGLRAQVVSYTIAIVESGLSKTSATFNRDAIWQAQKTSQPLIDFLLETAQRIHNELIATGPLHGKTNITEWAKMARCYEIMLAQVPLSLPTRAIWIQSKAMAAAEVKSQKSDDQEWDDVTAQVEVGNLPPSYWECMERWNRATPQLSDTETSILMMRISNRVVSPAQARALLKARKRLMDGGMVIREVGRNQFRLVGAK